MKRRTMMHAYPKSCGLSTPRRGLVIRRMALAALAVLVCSLLTGCGSAEQPKPSLESEDPALVIWPRAEKAIRLHFKADRDLNVYDSKAHSIQVCVYQLDKPDAFLDLARTQDGITALLKAEPFDKSVRGVTRLFVQPLEDAVSELDRMENATFVAIVCGYFDSTPEHSAKVWEIPPTETTSGFLWKTTTYSAGTLDLTVRLTARSMAEGGEQRQEPQ